jgi:hypothetical protein
MKINFNFGRKPTDIKTYAIIGIILTSVVEIVGRLFRVKEKDLYALIDEINRHFKLNDRLNDYYIKDRELLSQRVERDVDKAIETYKETDTSVIIEEPIYSEDKEGETALGGPMSISSPDIDKPQV